MAKYTVVGLVIALFTASFANASTMSMKERLAVGRKLDKSIPFAKEKYLPGSFIKELEKNLGSSADKAEFKKLQGNWSKYYSKDIGYRTFMNSFEVTYKKVPMITVKITSLNPYTIRINGGSEMIIRRDHYFTDMNEALKDAGYEFTPKKKKKTAWLNLLIPEAYAGPANAPADAAAAAGVNPATVQNSIFILGLSTFMQKPDGTLMTAMEITEAMASGQFLYPGVDAVKCNGQAMQGTYQQGEKVAVQFLSERKEGVKMKVAGQSYWGKPVSSEATLLCKGIANGVTVDLTKEDQIRDYGNHRKACLYLAAARPAAGLACTEITTDPPTQEALKNECVAMKQVGLSTAFEFYACKDDSCKESELTKIPDNVANIRQFSAWKEFGPKLESALQEVRDKFKDEIASGQIKEENGTFVVVPPDQMFAKRSSEFRALVAKIPKAPTEDKTIPYFDFRIAAMGFAGLLDCCYDTECKAEVYERGKLELQPSGAVQ